MGQYIVTVNKLNKRSAIPAYLPDNRSIVGVVFKGYKFEAQEADAADVPNPALGKWYKDWGGFYYWGGAITEIEESPIPDITPTDSHLRQEQVKGATGAYQISTVQKFLPYIIDTCNKYQIDTPIRQLCFLSQVGHESAGLHYTEELASGRAYEGRKELGNTEVGDGVRYKGRGLIQITGRGNYGSLTKDMNVDFIGKPYLLGGKNATVCTPDQLKYATLSAGWYWNSRALNEIADRINIQQPIDQQPNYKEYRLITKKINGGYNGLADRLSRYRSGVQFFR